MSISPRRVLLLRFEAAERRVEERLGLALSVLHGALNGLGWLLDHPGKTMDDYEAWRVEPMALAQALRVSSEARLDRLRVLRERSGLPPGGAS